MTLVGKSFGAVYVPIEHVTEHPRNYVEHDEGAIAASLSHFGPWRALVVQESTGFVIVGNGQLKAHRALGHAEVPVLYRDVEDDEALAILLADNWIGKHRGREMAPELLEVMRELEDERDLLALAGVDDDDVEALAKEVADLDRPLDLGAGKVRAQKLTTCPECGAEFKAKR